MSVASYGQPDFTGGAGGMVVMDSETGLVLAGLGVSGRTGEEDQRSWRSATGGPRGAGRALGPGRAGAALLLPPQVCGDLLQREDGLYRVLAGWWGHGIPAGWKNSRLTQETRTSTWGTAGSRNRAVMAVP